MRKKKTDCNEAAKQFLGKIIAIFHVSPKGKTVYRVKMGKSYSPNIFTCQVSFSPTGDEYYYKTCIDPVHFATSEVVLRCGDKQLRNLPSITDLMGYFEHTAFPEDIMTQTSKLMKAIRMDGYQVIENEDNLEIVRKTPANCEKTGA